MEQTPLKFHCFSPGLLVMSPIHTSLLDYWLEGLQLVAALKQQTQNRDVRQGYNLSLYLTLISALNCNHAPKESQSSEKENGSNIRIKTATQRQDVQPWIMHCVTHLPQKDTVNQSFSVHPVHRYEALTKYYATRWFRFVL